jgi:hypothetical protein
MFIHHIMIDAVRMAGIKFQKYGRYPELPIIKEI